jgi:hypothetical protein
LFPASAIAARNRAANRAPAIVFRLGARITESPFRVSGRIRFVLAPSILLWPSKGTVVLLRPISFGADGGRSRSCRAGEVGRARSRTGEEQAGDGGSNLDHGLSVLPLCLPMSFPRSSNRSTPGRQIVGDEERRDNGPRGSFSAQRGTRSPGRNGLGLQRLRISREGAGSPSHQCGGLVTALDA